MTEHEHDNVEELFPSCMGCGKMVPGDETPPNWGEFSLRISLADSDWDAQLDGELCPECMADISWLASRLEEIDIEEDDGD